MLETGRSFGELSLPQDKRRIVSVLCVSDCIFCTLKAFDYQRILSGAQEKKLSELVKFLSSLPYLSQWTYPELVQLSCYFKERELHRRTVLYREGDPATDIYIVKWGEVELTKTMKPDSRLSQHLSPKSGTPKQVAHLSILGAGELLGVEDALQSTIRSHTALCKTLSVAVLTIKKEDFSKTFLKDIGWTDTMKMLSAKRRIRDNVFNSFERVMNARIDTNSFPVPETPSKTSKASFSRRSFLHRVQEVPTQIRHLPEPSSLSPKSTTRKGSAAIPHFPRPQLALASPKDRIQFPNPDIIRSHSHHKYPERAVPMKTRNLKRRQHIRNATSQRPDLNLNLSVDLTKSTDRVEVRRCDFLDVSVDSSLRSGFELLSLEAKLRKGRKSPETEAKIFM